MIDTKIVEPLEDGVNGNSCLAPHYVSLVLLLKVELHENLLIALFVGAPNAFGTDIQMRVSQKI